MPKRIQRKRTKGWRMPQGAVYVGRPTIFGNPIMVTPKCDHAEAVKGFRWFMKAPQSKLVNGLRFESGEPSPVGALCLIAMRERIKRGLGQLRGKDLACWCPLDRPCHADVLIELANK